MNEIQEQIKKSNELLEKECIEIKEEIKVRYEIDKKEYIELLAKGVKVDKKIIFDEEFRVKYFKLHKIIELLEEIK